MDQHLAATLTDDSPGVTLEITAPDGRVLSVQVGIPNLGPQDEGTSRDDAFVVWLNTEDNGAGETWEPTRRELRVNVNDGPIWNYPDQGTHGYGTMLGVTWPWIRVSPSTNADLD